MHGVVPVLCAEFQGTIAATCLSEYLQLKEFRHREGRRPSWCLPHARTPPGKRVRSTLAISPHPQLHRERFEEAFIISTSDYFARVAFGECGYGVVLGVIESY